MAGSALEKEAHNNGLGVTRCGDSLFRWGSRTYIMGIINLSPDSFSGDGCSTADEALEKAHQLVEDGADVIDVGGESTRPDSRPIDVEEEIRRVIPFIKIAAGNIKVPVSVDTYKIEVARRALNEGANMINDVSGLRKEPELVKLVAQRSVPIVLTSNERGKTVTNIMDAVINNLQNLIKTALDAGVQLHNIIVDPGVGFGKTPEQNLEIVRRLDELKMIGRPILLGTSRKSFIGKVLDLPPENRFEGTAASMAIGICKGADIVRVHDVKQMKLVCRMSDAIVRGS